MDVECVDTEGQLCSVKGFSTQQYKFTINRERKMDGQESEIRRKLTFYCISSYIAFQFYTMHLYYQVKIFLVKNM